MAPPSVPCWATSAARSAAVSTSTPMSCSSRSKATGTIAPGVSSRSRIASSSGRTALSSTSTPGRRLHDLVRGDGGDAGSAGCLPDGRQQQAPAPAPRHQRTDAAKAFPSSIQREQDGGQGWPESRRLTRQPEAADCQATTISVQIQQRIAEMKGRSVLVTSASARGSRRASLPRTKPCVRLLPKQ